MAVSNEVNPFNNDIDKPLNAAQIKLGWENGRELDYWVPSVDIEGTIPKQLRGTLLRNGPGITDVYGKKLVHRELVR